MRRSRSMGPNPQLCIIPRKGRGNHRGRTASYPTAPAQIPACGFPAPGSSVRLAAALRVAPDIAIPCREVGLCGPALPVRHKCPLQASSHRPPPSPRRRLSRPPSVESEEVGRYHPASVRSLKRLVQFSRKPLSLAAPARSQRMLRLGIRWVSLTKPYSSISRRLE
jgi:hypothetical protein